MAEKITNIKERILSYIDYKGFKITEFFDGLEEIKYGSFKGVSKNSALNSSAIAEIITKYPDLNLTWLITGKGEMLVKNRVTRMLEFIKVEKIDRKKLAEKTKISSKIIDNLEKFDDVDFDILKSILAAYPKLSEEWLLYDIGNMYNSSSGNYKYHPTVIDDENNMVAEESINYNRMPSVVTVSREDQEKENIEIVPINLAAGYIGGGYAKEEFIKDLPKFRLPFLNNGTFRCFGVGGYSMDRIKDKDYFIGKFLDNISNFSEGKCYAVISKDADSMLVKRVFRHTERKDMIILRSDGNDIMNTYPDIHINLQLISEMWEHQATITFSEPIYDIQKFKEILKTNPKHITIDKD